MKKLMRRYYSLSEHFNKRFGSRVGKISVDAHFTCPNRDGKLSGKGCIFCDNSSFSVHSSGGRSVGLEEQIKNSMNGRTNEKFMLYFQAFSNTYGSLEELKAKYDVAKDFSNIVAISIGTRPDCVDEDILKLIQSYTTEYDVWIEYGLQSANDKTLKEINRGHSVKQFEDAVKLTKGMGIKICAHVIIGLPGETKEDYIRTAEKLAELRVDGVKIHPLYIVRNTVLENMHNKEPLALIGMDDYIKYVSQFLEVLPPETVIHRLTADCPEKYLIAPEWINRKQELLKKLDEYMDRSSAFQGRCFRKDNG